MIAPYATALASLVDPGGGGRELRAARRARASTAGSASTRRSTTARAAGDVDDARRTATARPAVVRAYFAHHQGMSLVALANVVCDDVFVARFHADPRVQATELLLQERVPREAILSEPRPAESTTAARRRCRCSRRDASDRRTRPARTRTSCRTAATPTARHARRRRLQHVARPGGHAPARRPDLRRRRALHLPARSLVGRRLVAPPTSRSASEPDDYEVTFELDKVTFRRRDGDFETQLEIAVSSGRRRRGAAPVDHQPRRPAARDRGDQLRRDRAGASRGRPRAPGVRQAVHRDRVRRAERRPAVQPPAARAPTKRRSWAFHVLGVDGPRSAAPSSGRPTARASSAAGARRPTRSRSTAARCRARPARCSIPIAALRERVRLAPGAFVRVTFATGVAPDRDAALALARKYRDGSAAARAFSMAFTHVHITLQHLGLSDEHAILFDRLASRVFGAGRLVHQPGRPRAQHARPAEPVGLRHLGRPADRARARRRTPTALPLVRQLLHAQEYWRVKGLRADVVILNEHPADYLDEMQSSLTGARAGAALGRLDRTSRAACSCCAPTACPRPTAVCSRAVARVVLRGDLGDLASQLDRPAPWLFADARRAARRPSCRRPSRPPTPVAGAAARHGERPRRLHARRPRVRRRARRRSRDAAAVVERPGQPRRSARSSAASGSAFTWAENSRENRLTPFANDPVTDPTGEAIYLRDDDTGAVWGATPGPLPRRADGGRWVVRHAAGRDALSARRRPASSRSSRSSWRPTIP